MKDIGQDDPMRKGSVRPGFTLIETVAATVCTGIVMAGLVSCLMLASHAFNEDRVALTVQSRTAEPLDRLLTDLRYAKSFSERTSTAVTFKVPDRDADGRDETIRYAWSGTAGDPLVMAYNGSDPAILVDAVQSLDFSYHERNIPGTGYARFESTATPFMINSHINAPDGHFGSFGTMPTWWYALYLEPNVPDGTTCWDFTQLCLSLRKSANADGYFAIQICTPTRDPIGPDTVLQEIVLHESTLTNQFQWHTFDFDTVKGLSPDQALFIVLKHAQLGGTQVMLGEYETGIDDQPGYAFYHTQDTGETYTLQPNQEMLFYACGVAH